MTETRLEIIRDAIGRLEVDKARDLIREEVRDNPSAEVYYLASHVALDDVQRVRFLEKALEIDPFNEKAANELRKVKQARGAAARGGAAAPPSSSHADPFASKSKWVSSPYSSAKGAAFELADVWTRFAALILDNIILYVLGTISGFVVGFLAAMLLPAQSQTDGNFTVLGALVGLAVQVGYHVYFLTQHNGRTPGKMAMRIRIVKVNGEKLTVLDAFLRNFVGYIISGLMLGLGYFWAFIDPQRQTVHDKIAGTLVVKD